MSVSKAKTGSVAGVVGGYAPLDSGLLVPTVYLPTVPVANGGTGATTAAGARTNLGLGTAAVESVEGTNLEIAMELFG